MGKILVYLQANKLACNSIMGHQQKNSDYWDREKDSQHRRQHKLYFQTSSLCPLFPHSDEGVTSWILHIPSVCITSLGS